VKRKSSPAQEENPCDNSEWKIIVLAVFAVNGKETRESVRKHKIDFCMFTSLVID